MLFDQFLYLLNLRNFQYDNSHSNKSTIITNKYIIFDLRILGFFDFIFHPNQLIHLSRKQFIISPTFLQRRIFHRSKTKEIKKEERKDWFWRNVLKFSQTHFNELFCASDTCRCYVCGKRDQKSRHEKPHENHITRCISMGVRSDGYYTLQPGTGWNMRIKSNLDQFIPRPSINFDIESQGVFLMIRIELHTCLRFMRFQK